MLTQEEYQKILEEYPEELSKEQFYKLAHIGKRTAQFLLESGTVPSKSTGKKTRKYTISTADAICFMKNREQIMELLSLPMGRYAGGSKSGKPSSEIIEKMRRAYDKATMDDCLDALKAKDVCEITGYGEPALIKR